MSKYNTNLKEWGDKGVEYPDGYNYSDNQPVDAYDNWFNNKTVEEIQRILNLLSDVDSKALGEHGNEAHSTNYIEGIDLYKGGSQEEWNDKTVIDFHNGFYVDDTITIGEDSNEGISVWLDEDVVKTWANEAVDSGLQEHGDGYHTEDYVKQSEYNPIGHHGNEYHTENFTQESNYVSFTKSETVEPPAVGTIQGYFDGTDGYNLIPESVSVSEATQDLSHLSHVGALNTKFQSPNHAETYYKIENFAESSVTIEVRYNGVMQ
jgi:hypothetical protein